MSEQIANTVMIPVAEYNELKQKLAKHETLLDELWEMSKDLKTEKEHRDLAQNMINKIRAFSKPEENPNV